MADPFAGVPTAIREQQIREQAMKKLPELIAQVDALTAWADQNGWDVATGLISSEISKDAPKKRGRPKKSEPVEPQAELLGDKTQDEGAKDGHSDT